MVLESLILPVNFLKVQNFQQLILYFYVFLYIFISKRSKFGEGATPLPLLRAYDVTG